MMRQPISLGRPYGLFSRFRPWLLPGTLLLVGLAIALAGGVTSTNLKSGTIFLVVVFAVLLVLWIAVQPTIGVYLLTAFVFLNLSDILEVQFGIVSINKIVVGLVFISILANRLLHHRKPFVFSGYEPLLLLYFLITLVSIFYADDPARALFGATNNFKDFVIILIIVQICDTEQSWKNLHWVILLSATFVASLSCYQVLTHDYHNIFFGLANAPLAQITAGMADRPRVSGPLSDPNFYGQTLLMALPFGICSVIGERRRNYRLLTLACTLIILLAIVFTYSRGSLIALMLLTILIVREWKLNPYKFLAGAGIALLVVVIFMPEGYLDRVLTLSDIFPQDITMQTEVSFRGRSSEMIIAVQMFFNNPILGLGYQNYENNYATYNSLLGLDQRFGEREPHDLYLEILAETGIVGFLSFVGVMAAILRGIYKAKQQLISIQREDLLVGVSAIEYSLVAFLTTSIFLHGAYIRYLWLFVGLAAGSTVLAKTLVRQQRAALTGFEEGVYVLRELVPLGGDQLAQQR